MKKTTIFREALGDTPVIRVIEFLIEGRGLDYSLTDIAENSNVGWTTLHRIWDNLLKFEIVQHTRQIGRAKLFKINEDNISVKHLISVYDTLLFQETEKHLLQKIKVRVKSS